ncbi:hypothetical protein TNCV_2671301 [Trichonephila clavipes]|nr:hypothetical protein TNCV_2671301 [Trichonephila clavipes]
MVIRETIPRNMSNCFATIPKMLVANTSEPYVSCIAKRWSIPLKNVNPFWKVFSMERAPTPSIKKCMWSMYKDRWPTWQNGVENSWTSRKRSDPLKKTPGKPRKGPQRIEKAFVAQLNRCLNAFVAPSSIDV